MLHLVDSKAGHCINSVAHYANLSQLHTTMEFESHCAHQPEYTLPCPLEVYQQPLKYRYLHITDTQRRPQWCPLLHCVHLELHFARYLLTVLFRASAHGCSQLKRQKLRVGDCAEGLK